MNIKRKFLAFAIAPLLFSCGKETAPEWPFERIGIGTENSITDMYFLDSDHGVLCGSMGLCKSTSDGGRKWTAHNAATQESFLSAFMLNQDRFYIGRTALFRTVDGGGSFYAISNMPAPYSVFGIFFKDENTGFVSKGGTILMTEDGGASWSEKYTGTVSGPIEFVSPQVGYTYGGMSSESVSSGQVVMTTDGGETWIALLVDSPQVTGADFIDQNIGYYTDESATLYKTTDGGSTWNAQSALVEDALCIAFVDSDHGYFGTYSGCIYETSDSGHSWSLVYAQEEENPVSRIVCAGSTVIAGGDGGFILRKK